MDRQVNIIEEKLHYHLCIKTVMYLRRYDTIKQILQLQGCGNINKLFLQYATDPCHPKG